MNNKEKFNELACIASCFKSAPRWALLVLFIKAILCVIPYLKVVIYANFINSSILVIMKHAPVESVIFDIVCVLLMVGYSKVERSFSAISWLKIEMGLRESYVINQITKIASLEYKHIENPDTLSLIHRTNTKSEEKIRYTYQILLEALTLFAQIACIFVIIAKVSFTTALAVVAISVPLFALAMKAGKRSYDTEQEVSNAQRGYEYLNKVNYSRESVDERSLFQYSDKVADKWNGAYEIFRKKKIWAILQNNMHLEGSSVVTSFITIIISALLLIPYYDKALSIGLYMSLFAAVVELVETMSWTFTDIISGITQNHLYLKDVDKFFSLSEESDGVLGKAEKKEILSKIEFKNVKFRYPQTDYYVLNGVSFVIEKGKHYAFVGTNGAGKSTIIKLITGLYKDYEGEILFNGKELRNYNIRELKAFFLTVYQDFAKYAVTMRDNLRFANMSCTDTEILNVAELAGLKDVINKLPDGINTPLGKIVEHGIDLSGGEWQRVAIARTMMSKNGIQILDEPTAALDPIMENKMYEEFSDASKNKTTIFISHRLGSTKLADIIFVLDNGVIKESGTHEKLMEQGTIYKNMYENQRKWYE